MFIKDIIIDDLISAANLAKLMGVSTRTLQYWRIKGTGPAYIKAGRRVLYREMDVEVWLIDRTRFSTSDTGVA